MKKHFVFLVIFFALTIMVGSAGAGAARPYKTLHSIPNPAILTPKIESAINLTDLDTIYDRQTLNSFTVGTTIRVSVASDGTQGNAWSGWPSISADGRYVAFESDADNLVSGDTNGYRDIFMHDRQTGQTSRVSVASDGTQGNSWSKAPSISADGRYVAFESNANNLVLGEDIGLEYHTFVHDRQTGQTQRVSEAPDGTEGNGSSDDPSMSADGRFVVFGSRARNLVLGDNNGAEDIFVHDRQVGQTSRVSVASDGTQGNAWSSWPSISADGRYVAFESNADNLVSGDTNGYRDIFMHDRQTGQTQRISLATNGTQGNGDSYSISISADGRYVAFYSYASNLVSDDTNHESDIFVYDQQTGTTTRVSLASDGTQGNNYSIEPSISSDGRYVAFYSTASNLVSNDTNGGDIFVHDQQTGTTTRVSLASDGTQGNNRSFRPSISGDGRYIAFYSDASNLVGDDTNHESDIFVHDREGVSYSISGHIADNLSNPIENVTVISNSGSTSQTDSNGNYTITGILTGTYTITPTKDGYTFTPASASVTVPPDQTGIDFVGTVNPTMYSISGQVTDGNSNSIAGVTISTSSGTATTNASGYYTFTSLTADDYTLTPSKNGYVFSPSSHAVTVPPNATAQDFTGVFGCGAATATKPIMLVTGWGGSVDKTLQTDKQLSHFDIWLGTHGYVEGCNLFYAQGTSPKKYLEQNGEIIANELCTFAATAKLKIPNWDGYFDIIAHSYGGLRARAFLESDRYDNELKGCSSPLQNIIKVDNLFTMGTPHGGEWPGLPLAFIIGLNAVTGGVELPAITEMQPPVRLWQNLQSAQAENVNYYLLGGDVRLQATAFSPLFQSVYWGWPFTTVRNTPNDFAVHQTSAYALAPIFWRYPHVNTIQTSDLHGDLYVEQPLLDPYRVLRSFVYPATAFEEEMCGRIGLTGCSALKTNITNANQQSAPSTAALVAEQTSPQQLDAAPLLDIQAGTLNANDVVGGQFEMSGSGQSQVNLYWSDEDVDLVLADPLGNLINSQTSASDPNTNYYDLNTGFGFLASYQITNTLTGTWTYTITAGTAVQPIGYRLLAVPSTPIAVAGSVPSWLPNNSSVVITSTVTYSVTTPVTGGGVTARIQRPDDTVETITLFDDGVHQDGAANDGVFGTTYTQTSVGGSYGFLFTATGNYNSETYERTATAVLMIAPDNASLANQYSDNGIDDNGNNFYEWLEVLAEITVTEPSTYTLSIDLYAGETYITHATEKVWLEVGTQTVALRFDGKAINEKQLDGPYTIRNVMLLDESEATLMIEAADNVHTTAAYTYQQFGAGYKVYLPVVIRD